MTDKLRSLPDEVLQKELKLFVTVCSSFMSMPLFLVFWIADLIYMPTLKWECLLIRSCIIPISLITNYSIKRSENLLQTQIIGTAFVFSNSLIISTLIILANDPSGPYYAGLNLVAIASLSFLPWTKAFIAINTCIIYTPFLIFSLLRFQAFNIRSYAVNLFFIVGTVVISLVSRYFTIRLRRSEFDSRKLLETEVINRGIIIEKSTKESVRLTMLTKQFSPQVVHALKMGNIDLNADTRRSQICAIFIDIVNSTDRLVRLDKDNVQTVIKMFMEDTMTILLKYDITIDKFLGDGVLGFCNAPIAHEDYVSRVIQAAIEIRLRILERRGEYINSWLNELQIRVGIASGFANVGFYGSDKYFKSYTAIGRVVNLACRLCSIADVNQIVVSNDILQSPASVDFSFKSLGYHKLKGFDQDLIEAFELTNSVDDGRRVATGVSQCPNGHGILHLDVNDKGIYVFLCRTCHFQQSP